MSAGEFTTTRYQTADGGICSVRVQPETLQAVVNGATNTAPAGEIDQEASAIVSGGRGNGVFCRKVRLAFTGEPPEGYKEGGTVVIPWLQPTAWNGFRRGQTGTYLGVAVRVVGRTAESVG
jgi:hypothetical protein